LSFTVLLHMFFLGTFNIIFFIQSILPTKAFHIFTYSNKASLTILAALACEEPSIIYFLFFHKNQTTKTKQGKLKCTQEIESLRYDRRHRRQKSILIV
jgi:hypothetical protein